MKRIFLTTALVLGSMAQADSGLDHGAHAKHGMFVYGDKEIYASHIVYKSPHNFQVITKVNLPLMVRAAYRDARIVYPGQALILVLDPMDIGQLATSRPELSGTLIREDSDGQKREVFPNVKLSSDDYQVLYFNELPLSLESHDHFTIE